MIIRWREFSGRPNDALLERLHRSIEQYQAGSSSLKIGLTTDPMRSWSSQRWDGWSEMVVIYSTSSQDFAAAVEQDLTRRGWAEHYTAWNYEAAGKGLPGSYTRYYVYVLLEENTAGP